jgi:hypothetical protein
MTTEELAKKIAELVLKSAFPGIRSISGEEGILTTPRAIEQHIAAAIRDLNLVQQDPLPEGAVPEAASETTGELDRLRAENEKASKTVGELQLDLGEANREIGNLEALREADCTKLLAYQAELRRQLNEAWMRLAYDTADRIAELIGEPKPSEHEAEDAKPDEREQQRQMEVQPPAEWPKVYRLDVPPPDICEVTFLNATQKAVSRHIKPDSEFDGLSWEYGEVNAANNWKLYSVGGRVVDGDEQPKHLTEALKQSAEEIDKEWRR